jgi:hypothetical protein
MGARNRGGIGLSYRPARLRRLAELIPWNQFRGPINILKFGLTGPSYAGGIDSFESILGLLKSLKIQAQDLVGIRSKKGGGNLGHLLISKSIHRPFLERIYFLSVELNLK